MLTCSCKGETNKAGRHNWHGAAVAVVVPWLWWWQIECAMVVVVVAWALWRQVGSAVVVVVVTRGGGGVSFALCAHPHYGRVVCSP